MEEKKNPKLGKVGGQAVLEGIMMRGPESYTTAVRKADGTIIRDSHPNEIKKKNWFKKLPLVRGVVSFVESMVLSFSTLNFAAEALEIEINDEDSDTFGGYVLGLHGSVPEDGSTFDVSTEKLDIRIESIKEHKIEKAIVSVKSEEDEDEKDKEKDKEKEKKE